MVLWPEDVGLEYADNFCLLSRRVLDLSQMALNLEKERSGNLTSHRTLPICMNGQNIEGPE